jgi:uncharacterized membrane protein
VPTLYEALLFLHIVGAIAWIGGATAHIALMAVAKRSERPETLITLLRLDDRLGPVLYVPAGLLVLLGGIGLVLEGDWGFDQGWVIAGLVLLGLAYFGGAAYFIPAGKRLHRVAESEGPTSDAAMRLVAQIERVAMVDLLVLLAAVYVMVAKPGL